MATGHHIRKVNIVGTAGAMDAKQSGDWAYIAGTGGATLNIVGRVVGLSVYAPSLDGTLVIDGGDTITIRKKSGWVLNPKGNLVNPELVISASLDYVVEYVVS